MSQNSYLPDYEYELGGRFTVGRLFNCVDGWEGVFVGPYKWDRQATLIGAGNLQSHFIPEGGYTAAEVDTFNNADQHFQDLGVEAD